MVKSLSGCSSSVIVGQLFASSLAGFPIDKRRGTFELLEIPDGVLERSLRASEHGSSSDRPSKRFSFCSSELPTSSSSSLLLEVIVP